jgi:predicted permease
VVAEVSLAVVLVIGAGLMIRSLAALGRVDLGFNPENVLTMRVSVPATKYDTPEKVVDFYRRLNERVRALPGVQSSGFVRVLPLATTIGDSGLDVEGFEERPGVNAKGDWQIASDGSFEAMGARLIRGRWFTSADTSDSQPVAVINETLARTYWKDPDQALGGRIRLGSNPRRPWFTVVGMVADERHNGVTGIVKEKFFIPHSQWHVGTLGSVIRGGFVVVRTTGDPLQLAGPVRAQIREMDPNLPVANIRPMTEVVSTSLATPRLTGFLMGAFAAIALTLAAVGIYGVLSYLVARRTHEIGIRLAVGADRSQVLALVLRQGLTLAGTGIAAGVVAALLLTRLMQTLLYQVRPTDPWTFTTVVLVLVGVALLASALPAFRATRVSPLIALRTE